MDTLVAAVLILLAFVVLDVLAVRFGVDSRDQRYRLG